MKNSERDGNTRLPDLLSEKPVCRSRSKLEPNMEQQTGSKWGRSKSRLILSPCLFSLYAEYIIQNARLDEAQAGIKIAGRNINNLRYVDDIILTAESEEELKGLLKVKEESEKADLKLNIEKKN